MSDKPKSATPVRCAIIQLGCTSDLLQSLMALRAAKQLYPQLEIHLIVREKSADAARRVPWLSGLTVLPTSELLQSDEPLKALARWVGPLVQSYWDLAVNWTFSEASSYLTALLPARVKLGSTRRRDADMPLYCPDGWTQYFHGVIQQGIPQNIHVTDALTTQLLTALQIHLGDPDASGGAAQATARSFFKLEHVNSSNGRGPLGWRHASRRWVALQPGRLDSPRAWGSERWAELAHQILENHSDWGIVLLGSASESNSARAIVARLQELGHEDRAVLNLAGQTSFDLWASVLSQCQWLASSEAAPIHLANVLGTRVVQISSSETRYVETGPYGNGHYVVIASDAAQPAHPHAVYGAWLYAQEEWNHRRQTTVQAFLEKRGKIQPELSSAVVLRSRIRDVDHGGGVVYEAQSPQPLTLTDWLAQAMGHVARSWYCGWVPKLGQEIARPAIAAPLLRALRETDEAAQVLEQILGEAIKTSDSLAQVTRRLRSDRLMQIDEKESIQKLSTRLQEIDTLVERLGAAAEPLRAFSAMAKVMMHNLPGKQLGDIAADSVDAYRQLRAGATTIRQWVRHTLELVRPMAIPGQTLNSEPELSPR